MSTAARPTMLLGVTAALLTAALAGCLGSSNQPTGLPSPVGGILAPVLEFAKEVPIDTGHRGGEPSVLVDLDNNYYVSAPSGLVTSVVNTALQPGSAIAMGPLNRQSFIWKSTDQGVSWTLLSLTPPPLPPLRGDLNFGGGDTDMAVDDCNTLYFADLWLGNIGVSHSTDGGDTWVGVPITGHQSPLDRQWLAASTCGTVYMAYQTFQGQVYVIKSTDSGMTFPQQTLVTEDYGIIGNLIFDKASGFLYVVLATMDGSGVQVFKSEDEGQSWHQHMVWDGDANVINIFPAIANDVAGNLYAVWSEHKAGSYNIYLSTSEDQGETWSAPLPVSGPEGAGTEVFPWVAAGDAGKVAIVWYGTNDTKETTDDIEGDWFVYMAASANALDPASTWVLEQASTGPMHKDEICTQGLGCTLPQPVGTRGNRNLADFFEVAIDLEGKAVTAYSNDYDTADQLISLPYFVQQSGGIVFQQPMNMTEHVHPG